MGIILQKMELRIKINRDNIPNFYEGDELPDLAFDHTKIFRDAYI